MDSEIKIDENLTPENAASKNLVWVQDVIYDIEAPLEANLNIKKYIELGFTLGKCASSSSVNNFVGLYKRNKLS